MALVTDKPQDLPTTNALDELPERTDGEMRHGRQLTIQSCWESGKKPPTTDGQPALFDEDGNPITDDEDTQDGE